MQTNHIPKQVLFARGIRRHIRRLDHVISEQHLVAELIVRKLWPLSNEELKNLKVIYPETSRFVDAFIESREAVQK